MKHNMQESNIKSTDRLATIIIKHTHPTKTVQQKGKRPVSGLMITFSSCTDKVSVYVQICPVTVKFCLDIVNTVIRINN